MTETVTQTEPKNPSRSTANTWTLRILAAALILTALVIVFFLGKSSAVNTTADNRETTVNPTGQTGGETPRSDTDNPASNNPSKAALSAFVSETGLIPSQDFAPENDDENTKKAFEILRKQADTPQRTLGKNTAALTVTVLEDFSCPMCTKWQKETLPLLQPLIDEGKVKLQWFNMVIFAQQYGSDLAAQGAAAAMRQDKLWDFVQAAYNLAGEGDHPVYDRDTVFSVAQKAGVPDMNKFRNDLDSPQVAGEVQKETSLAQSVGVNGTPAFVIGNSFIGGAYPSEYFLNTIKYQQFLASQN